MIRVRANDRIDRYPDADDFTADYDSGTLSVKKTDDEGVPQALYAVYARGGWDAVYNDDPEETDQ